ncbi:hypothetical protein [Rhizobium mesosinicum]|uniref:Uncharacterized protein n=1 Tax=Rhizobium mesosinicum TaxID=335017 RepID=A0ABS7GLY6_9HYPH|nr:hypothetical protein [Rhizobium mesosinicum]MBW9051005.1 hypothetical protein [Rhizobium mesosinicum]
MLLDTETTENGLAEELRRHIEFLRSTEPTFGHATALSKYGRYALPREKKPEWLKIGLKRACFYNATAYAAARDDVFYAEGYALEPALTVPVQHAWLVDADGRVLDPTWSRTKCHIYFGISFKRSFVMEMLATSRNEPGILVNMHLLRRVLRTDQAVEAAILRAHVDDVSSGKMLPSYG